jgi:hypothetical protein
VFNLKKLTVVLLLLSSIFIFTGCAAVLIGAGVVGGMELSSDSAKIAKDTSFDAAYSAAFRTIQDIGTITMENKYSGRIEAEVRDSKIRVQISRISRQTVSIKITARKKGTLLPNVDLAQEILNSVVQKL